MSYPSRASVPPTRRRRWKKVLVFAVAATALGVAGAAYLTISLDADAGAAESRLGAYVERYYQVPFAVMRKVQGLFRGHGRGGRGLAARLRACGRVAHLGELVSSLRSEEKR